MSQALDPNHSPVIDPVCGMTVDSSTARDYFEFEGRHYYFCSHSCAAKFKTNPGQFASSKPLPSSVSEKANPSGGLSILGQSTSTSATKKEIDPVCGMSVDVATAKLDRKSV